MEVDDDEDESSSDDDDRGDAAGYVRAYHTCSETLTPTIATAQHFFHLIGGPSWS